MSLEMRNESEMMYTSAVKTEYVVVLRDEHRVLQEIEAASRGEALAVIDSMRADRPEETLELHTVEVFQ
jgi:hypothetical protein